MDPITDKPYSVTVKCFQGPQGRDGHKGGMVTIEYQDVMVEMELQGDKEKREIMVCKDQLHGPQSMHFKFDLLPS